VTNTRLPPEQWWPAGNADLLVRSVTLADGVRLRVIEAGPAHGTPVLLMHGWAVTAYLWRHNVAALAAAGFRVFAADMPGHGLSDAPLEKGSYTVATMAFRVGLLLDALGLDRVPLVAQSMAGRIAVEVALSGRATKLALFGPVGFGEVRPERNFAPLIPDIPGTLAAQLFPRRVVEIVQRRVYGKLGWFTERDIDEYWAPSQFPDVLRAQVQMLREFTWEPLDEATLARCAAHTLVVFGTSDRTVKPVHAARLVSAMPHGRLELIEGGGHVVMEEVPDRVNALLTDFLAGG